MDPAQCGGLRGAVAAAAQGSRRAGCPRPSSGRRPGGPPAPGRRLRRRPGRAGARRAAGRRGSPCRRPRTRRGTAGCARRPAAGSTSPAPLPPRTVTTAPAGTVSDTWRSARTGPYPAVRSLTSRAGAVPPMDPLPRPLLLPGRSVALTPAPRRTARPRPAAESLPVTSGDGARLCMRTTLRVRAVPRGPGRWILRAWDGADGGPVTTGRCSLRRARRFWSGCRSWWTSI